MTRWWWCIWGMAAALVWVGASCGSTAKKPASNRPERRPSPYPYAQPGKPLPQASTLTPAHPRPAPAFPVMGDPQWYPRSGKINNRWTTIVIHHSATATGSASSFDRAHRGNGWDELGYHFVIGNGSGTPDGHVEVGSRWHKQKHGAHCKTPDNYFNDHGIGICLVGDFTKSRPTRAQLESLRRLVTFLSYHCDIPPYRVTTHKDVTRKTQCPGNSFPIAWLRQSITPPTHHATSMP